MPLNIWYCESKLGNRNICQVLLCLFVLKIDDDGFKRLGIGRASYFSTLAAATGNSFQKDDFGGNKFFAIVKVIWLVSHFRTFVISAIEGAVPFDKDLFPRSSTFSF